MPFGLRNAPAHFQKTIVAIVEVAPFLHVVVYLDDIVVYGGTESEVWAETIELIRRLVHAGLMINLKKSQFLV